MKLVFKNGSYIDFNKGVWVGLKAIVVTLLLILMLAIAGDWDMREANEKSPAATKQQDFKWVKKIFICLYYNTRRMKMNEKLQEKKEEFYLLSEEIHDLLLKRQELIEEIHELEDEIIYEAAIWEMFI